MPGPLAGIKVFDVSVAAVGPWTGMLLGALGADVIKVEHEKSDLIHAVPPPQRGLGAVYSSCNLNKRGIDLNLKDKLHREAAYRIIQDMDIFLENMRPGTVARLGFGYETLSKLNPRLIHARSSAWGYTGPMARMTGADSPIQAFSGWASLTGQPGGMGELNRYFGHVDINSSFYFLMAILQGLLIRQKTGRGLQVESSMLGGAIHVQTSRIAEYLATGKSPVPLGSAAATTVPHQAFLCADRKYLAVAAPRPEHWPALCQALGDPALRQDQRLVTNAGRVAHRDELIPRLEAIFKTKPTRWWEVSLTRLGVPNSRFLDLVDCFTHAQYRENELLVEIDIPHQGGVSVGNFPWQFSETKATYRPSPYPGQHTAEVLLDYGMDPDTMKPLPGIPSALASGQAVAVTQGETPDRPSVNTAAVLAGCRVIDITQGLCGPFASLMLADAGAEVIKIEPPGGDYARTHGPPFDLTPGPSPQAERGGDGNGDGASSVFAALNRGKKSVVLDLTTAEGMEALLALLATADVFTEDLGPDVADRAGFGYDILSKKNPGLIYCGITPWGRKGPLKDRPAAELLVQAMATYPECLGRYGEPPVRMGADIAHANTAAAAFHGILASLYHRETGGRGQRVDVTMLGTLVHMRGLIWAAQGNPDRWEGWQCEAYTRHPDYGWRAKDRPLYFSLRRGDEQDYFELLIELGLEEYVTDPRFADGGRQVTGHGDYAEEAIPIWEKAFSDKTAEQVCEIINRHHGEAMPFHDYGSLFAHPQLGALDMVHRLERPGGSSPVVLPPWRIDGARPVVGAPAPSLGQHTREVLGSLAR